MQFVSTREKRYWIYAVLVTLGIYSSLFLGPAFLKIMDTQSVQAVIYGLGLILVLITIVLFAIGDKKWIRLPVLIGLVAVYMLLFLRLSMAERTHLIEYSVLTVFVLKALKERKRVSHRPSRPQVWAFVLAVSIGILDEIFQLFLPERIFDFNDILFNTGAVLFVLSTQWFVQYAKKKWPTSGPLSS